MPQMRDASAQQILVAELRVKPVAETMAEPETGAVDSGRDRSTVSPKMMAA